MGIYSLGAMAKLNIFVWNYRLVLLRKIKFKLYIPWSEMVK